MPVQRTPPQRANQRPTPSSRPQEGGTTLVSPSRAFQSSNPAVRRTPPPGTAPIPSSAVTPQQDVPVSPGLHRVPHSSSSAALVPAQVPQSTPPAVATVSETQKTPPPLTPARKPPQSTRKTPAQVLDEPAIPVPIDDGAIEDWGKRYEITLDTLELAVRAGTQKWT